MFTGLDSVRRFQGWRSSIGWQFRLSIRDGKHMEVFSLRFMYF